MANLGVKGPGHYMQAPVGRLVAPLIKKCAILAVTAHDDQSLEENYDECCVMLRAIASRHVNVWAVLNCYVL
ncbi:hypothetical protein AO275_11945 [Pseudomonas viridiflava]|nr:hypothetical protein AO275_11945 [Pseudomonas viridiflava]